MFCYALCLETFRSCNAPLCRLIVTGSSGLYSYAFSPCAPISCGVVTTTQANVSVKTHVSCSSACYHGALHVTMVLCMLPWCSSQVCQESIKIPGIQYNAGVSPVWSVTNSIAAKVTYRALSESVIRFVPTQHAGWNCALWHRGTRTGD